MAENVLSIIGTVASKVPDIAIKNGQLIFIPDSRTIALDLNNRRTFYNQIISLETDTERNNMLAPINGSFYFVIETAVLWNYQNKWVQITTPPEEVVSIGATLPQLGSKKTLYVNTSEENISIWDDATQSFKIMGEKIYPIKESDIKTLFN